ncbi:MAG: AI-2E family transporter [Planctomycetes bacterium]|nr:AI-2E family transporter [Planctomycetota bacterium]
MSAHTPPEDQGHELRVPWTTILKLVGALILVVVAIKLFHFGMLVMLAVLLAVTLFPLVVAMRNRGLPHGIAVGLVGLGLALVVVGLLWLIVPPMLEQGEALVRNLPEVRERLHGFLPTNGPLARLTEQSLEGTAMPDPPTVLKHAMAWGKAAIGGVTEIGLVLVISIYLVLDGERTYTWLLPYLPRKHRGKMHETAYEVSQVVFAYMAGQFITSLLCAAFTFVVLTVLHVPAALILSVLAGILDILPVLGFFLSIIPAVLLALTVSPTTAMLTAGFYLLYNVFENYLIVPKVYGNRLRMSTLTVLLAVLVGGILAGVTGAIIVLPLVASYPIIERIWLKEFLGRDVVKEHAKDSEPPASTIAQAASPPAQPG